MCARVPLSQASLSFVSCCPFSKPALSPCFSLDATAKLVRLELGPKAPQTNVKPKSDQTGLVRLSELKKDELEAFLKLKPGAGLAMSMELPHWTKVCIP